MYASSSSFDNGAFGNSNGPLSNSNGPLSNSNGDMTGNISAPGVVWTLIGINTLLFALKSLNSQRANAYVGLDEMALVPGELVASPLKNWPRVISSMFAHNDILHLAFNMSALYRFGAPMERAWGHWSLLGLYLFSGIGTNIVYTVLYRKSEVGLVGASAAISGLMAAYYFQFDDKVNMTTWLLFQIVSAALAVQTGISYSAHLIGFAFGTVYYFARRYMQQKS